jgi:hypothetical protein
MVPLAIYGCDALLDLQYTGALRLSVLSFKRLTMAISDQRLEEVRAWLSGESKQDPSVRPEELAAIANELKQLRLRIMSKSRTAAGSSH